MIFLNFFKIQGDAYLGVCVLSNSAFSRWWLSLTPLAVASSFGSVAFALGLCSLRSVKDQLQIDSGTKSKLETFVLRMTGFSLFVLIPQLTQIVLKFYEAEQQPKWEKNFYGENCDDLFVPCLADEDMIDEKPSTGFIIMKYFILLLPALAPMVWIANSKLKNDFFMHYELNWCKKPIFFTMLASSKNNKQSFRQNFTWMGIFIRFLDYDWLILRQIAPY